jgi:hypothetical protein
MASQAPLEASFGTLALSMASAAAMSLGLAPNPQSGKTEVDLQMARFNIDMLVMLREKTKGNLNAEENEFLSRVITDLQLKFVEANKNAKTK